MEKLSNTVDYEIDSPVMGFGRELIGKSACNREQ